MRILAKESGVGLSSIYHFFNDKDEILKEIFDNINKNLGIERAKLPKQASASRMLKDRILFQFKHIEDVVFVLKYYLHFRSKFSKNNSGYLPTKASLHIEEVIKFGVTNKEFSVDKSKISSKSKVVAHAINGYLLEYFPQPPKDEILTDITDQIHEFIMLSLKNKEVIISQKRANI